MPSHLPDVIFHLRLPDADGNLDWADKTSAELFADKKIVLFAVPGAFTPTCSKAHLPGYEALYSEFSALGIDAIYCVSVNDAFIMTEWAKAQHVKNVMMLADGNGDFSLAMGMLVKRTSQGLGLRSWRYSLYAENGAIQHMFTEPGLTDNPKGVPLDVSSAPQMLDYLKTRIA